MKCPFCGKDEDKVLESRTISDGEAIRRRRECLGCGERFTSYERIETAPVMVIKRDGRREPFLREKIENGIRKAVEKRPVSIDSIELLINDVEKTLNDKIKKEVTSLEIGELIMERLHKLDEVAYVRFASVYRQFGDVKEFVKEVEDISE